MNHSLNEVGALQKNTTCDGEIKITLMECCHIKVIEALWYFLMLVLDLFKFKWWSFNMGFGCNSTQCMKTVISKDFTVTSDKITILAVLSGL